jgi:hypothetical protein
MDPRCKRTATSSSLAAPPGAIGALADVVVRAEVLVLRDALEKLSPPPPAQE